MIKNIYKYFTKKFQFRSWHFLFTITIALLIDKIGSYIIFVASHGTAGMYDPGIYQTPLVVTVLQMIYVTTAVLIMRIIFPAWFSYWTDKEGDGDNGFSIKIDIKQLRPHQRICYVLVILLSIYFSSVLLSGQIMGNGRESSVLQNLNAVLENVRGIMTVPK